VSGTEVLEADVQVYLLAGVSRLLVCLALRNSCSPACACFCRPRARAGLLVPRLAGCLRAVGRLCNGYRYFRVAAFFAAVEDRDGRYALDAYETGLRIYVKVDRRGYFAVYYGDALAAPRGINVKIRYVRHFRLGDAWKESRPLYGEGQVAVYLYGGAVSFRGDRERATPARTKSASASAAAPAVLKERFKRRFTSPPLLFRGEVCLSAASAYVRRVLFARGFFFLSFIISSICLVFPWPQLSCVPVPSAGPVSVCLGRRRCLPFYLFCPAALFLVLILVFFVLFGLLGLALLFFWSSRLSQIELSRWRPFGSRRSASRSRLWRRNIPALVKRVARL